jgi:hypothetical protein
VGLKILDVNLNTKALGILVNTNRQTNTKALAIKKIEKQVIVAEVVNAKFIKEKKLYN